MTSTIAPPIASGRRRIPSAELNANQTRFVIGHVLDRLGSAHGLAEDEPPIPYTDRAERLSLSTLAAWQIGLTLTPGAEIAQCHDCTNIVDGALTEESAGVIRCDRCHADHTNGAQHVPDTYDVWADYYRT
ncbi:hypothetical protein ACFVY4_26905 [Streptomyces sp. NPDC058299]|uniref:hypothetical protein n=1 Tax=Streptomyces sp. NPDC058299 TaxID=3346435 RepID=UPI0036F1006A